MRSESNHQTPHENLTLAYPSNSLSTTRRCKFAEAGVFNLGVRVWESGLGFRFLVVIFGLTVEVI